MPPPPLVSVVMPVFNTAVYVGEAIESILAQTYLNFEFIIIDDASSDNSIQVINTYQDQRIRLIVNKSNQGISLTRNRGMAEANGKYIAVFDSDDISLPHRLEKQVNFLEEHSDFGLIGGQVIPIGSDSNPVGHPWLVPTKADEMHILLLFTNCFAQPSVMLRKSALPEKWYDPSFTTAGDYELWTRLLRSTKGSNLSEPLIRYRIHNKGITRRADKANSLHSVKKIIKEHLAYLGLSFSEEELILFQQFSRNSYDPERWLLEQRFREDKQTLVKCLYLLDKIEEANDRQCKFDIDASRRVLREQKEYLLERYVQVTFSETDQYDLRLLSHYFFSPFRLYRYCGLRYTLTLSLKCLTRLNPASQNKRH